MKLQFDVSNHSNAYRTMCISHAHRMQPHTCHIHSPHMPQARPTHAICTFLHTTPARSHTSPLAHFRTPARILHAHLLLACRKALSHLSCRMVDSLLLVLMLLPTANGFPHFRPTDHANLHFVRKPIGQKSIGESLFACFCEPLQPAPTPIFGPHPAPHIQGRQPYGQSATDRFRPPGRRSIQVPFLHQRSGEFLCDLLVNILFP